MDILNILGLIFISLFTVSTVVIIVLTMYYYLTGNKYVKIIPERIALSNESKEILGIDTQTKGGN